VIRSFGDRQTEALFFDRFVREFQGIARAAKRKLEMLNAVSRLDDLLFPPGNRLEALRGGLAGHHSIRINDQWRVVFRWADGHAHDVRIMDYH
jgi:proteic killer suppression protein